MSTITNNYQPTPTQMKAHRALNRYKLFGGAMSGGKTRWLCEEAKDLSMRYPGNRGIMLRYHLTDFKNSTLKILLECLPLELIASHNQSEHLITLINGSEIMYMGVAEQENVSKLKSMEVGWFAIDEASEVPKDTFLLLQSRLRRRLPDGRFPHYFGLLASNPDDCWLKDDFVMGQGGEDFLFIPSLPKDNPHIPKDYESNLRKTYPDDWVKRFLEGSWDDLVAGDILIPSDWVKMAVNREIEIEDKKLIGADIARFGDDEIVIDYGMGGRLIEQDVSTKQDLMATVGRIVNKRAKNNVRLIVVDDAALGGGVTDRLKEQGEKVMPVNGGTRAITDGKFSNLKSEIWWYAREMFKSGTVSILNEPILMRQLSSIKYMYRSNGTIAIEPKDAVKNRLGRSPDRADALTLMLWGNKFINDPKKDFYRRSNILGLQSSQLTSNKYGWTYTQQNGVDNAR